MLNAYAMNPVLVLLLGKTRMRYEATEIIRPALQVIRIAVPGLGSAQALFPGHQRPPAQRMQLRRVDPVAHIVEGAIFDKLDVAVRLGRQAEEIDNVVHNVNVAFLDLRAYIVDLIGLATMQDGVKGARSVLDVQKVACMLTRAVYKAGPALRQQTDTLGNELVGELVRPVHVVAACDDHRQSERLDVAAANEFGGGLATCVRVRGCQDR